MKLSKSILKNLKESFVDKKNNVDLEELARQIMSEIELYDENLMNEEDDVFAGTQDSYAVEVFEQNLYDILLYSGLFQIEDIAKELEEPSEDGKKLDKIYQGIVDVVENRDSFKDNTDNLLKYMKENLGLITEGVETKAGNDFDEVASYMYNEANGDIDYIPDFGHTNDYIASVTKKEYNALYKAVESAIENVVDHMYNGSIELSDRSTINRLTGDYLDEYDPDVTLQFYQDLCNDAFGKFEEETGVEAWLDGRMGRHVVVANNYENARDYDTLCNTQEKWEDWVVEEFAKTYSKKPGEE